MIKLIYLITFSCLFVAIGCGSDDLKDLKGTWSLVNISGGLIGVDCDYAKGDIEWIFDGNNSLTINSAGVNTSCASSGYADGTYKYAVKESNDKMYLILNDEEIGKMDCGDSTFTIDYNFISLGAGADGFYLTFEKYHYSI